MLLSSRSVGAVIRRRSTYTDASPSVSASVESSAVVLEPSSVAWAGVMLKRPAPSSVRAAARGGARGSSRTTVDPLPRPMTTTPGSTTKTVPAPGPPTMRTVGRSSGTRGTLGGAPKLITAPSTIAPSSTVRRGSTGSPSTWMCCVSAASTPRRLAACPTIAARVVPGSASQTKSVVC